jgi:transposase-like protein
MTAEQIGHARDLLTRPDNTVSSIARLLGVSLTTIYKYVPKVTIGRQGARPPGKRQRRDRPISGGPIFLQRN